MISAEHIFTVLYICLLICIVLFGSYIVDEIGVYFYETKGNNKNGKIFDLVHEITPDLHEYEILVNIIPLIFLVLFLLVPNGFQLLKEFSGKFLLLCFIRALTLIMTILPKHEKCNRRFELSNCYKGQCYDKIFSGHTSFVFLAALIFLREGLIPFWGLLGIVGVEMATILVTRSHYTIDVFMALAITYLVYDGDYHIFSEFITKIEKEVTEVASEASS